MDQPCAAYTYEVDYEMHGRDLIDRQAFGAHRAPDGPPAASGLTYELFLDEEGRKISKSVAAPDRGHLRMHLWSRCSTISTRIPSGRAGSTGTWCPAVWTSI